MKYLKALFSVAGIMGIVSNPGVVAQSARSARSLGMADSYLTLASNCEAAAINPANLALSGRRDFSLKLFSISGSAANNAFSLADYNRYNGAYLSESDKQDILAKIPDDGLAMDFDAGASALTFSVGSFALTTEVVAGGKGTLPKGAVELALMGNRIGETVTADGTGGVAWSAVAVGVSHGRELFSKNGWDITGGVTLKYLRGLGYFVVEGLSAQATTLTTGFSGSGGMTTAQSLGGSGYAVDLGFAAENGKNQFGLVFRNLLASLSWKTELEKTIYRFHFENITLESGRDDSLWTSDESDLPINLIRLRPPLEIEAGAARSFGNLLTAACIKQGFENTAFVSKNPRFAFGIEYGLVKHLALRSGFTVGGNDRVSAAAGMGISLGSLRLDAAYASTSRLVPWGGKGGQFALSTILEFR